MSSFFFQIGVAIIVLDIIAALFIIVFIFRKKKEGQADHDRSTADRSAKKTIDTTEKKSGEKESDGHISEDLPPSHRVFPGDVGWDLVKDTGGKNKKVVLRRSGLEDLDDSLYIFKRTKSVWVCPYCDAENPPENRRCSVCGESNH